MDGFLFFIRLHILDSIIGLPVLKSFITYVFRPIVIVSIISLLASYVLDLAIPDSIIGLFLFCSVSIICTAITILYLGLSYSERSIIKSYISRKINKIRH